MNCCNDECNQGRDCPWREAPAPFQPMTDFLWALATVTAACVSAFVIGWVLYWGLK